MRPRGRAWAGLLLLAGALCWARSAAAEVVLFKTDSGYEFFTEGRLGGFFEAVQGQTLPQRFDQNGNLTHTIGDGGIDVGGLLTNLPMGATGQGDVSASRVRSGFLGNILAFGLRRKLTDTVAVTGYISMWANIEDENQRAFVPAFPDAREGYVRVIGPAGSLLVGRALTLFSRGATEIDFLYGHRFGVGNPAGFTTQGPSGGFVGFGVLAATFNAGIVYGTPSFHGLMLTAGYYDPTAFVGLYWGRTEWGRGEGELTFDQPLGTLGKIHLFANGAFRRIYASQSDRSTSVWGGGVGGRVELSVFRLGIAAHSGQGLEFGYAFDGSNAVVEQAAPRSCASSTDSTRSRWWCSAASTSPPVLESRGFTRFRATSSISMPRPACDRSASSSSAWALPARSSITSRSSCTSTSTTSAPRPSGGWARPRS